MAPEDAPALAARLVEVSAGYRSAAGERTVLDRASFELRRSELVALLGANASGKTTILRLLAGVLPAKSGRIELFGRPLETWSRERIARCVAVLPQALELPTGFRVSEVVAFGRIPHAGTWFGSDPADEEAVASALRDAGAEEIADRPVAELSGGERQRVLVALALAQDPRFLLLDEPTLHLDVAHQLALVRMLDRLRRSRDLTVLAVLHDVNLAATFADRSLFVHRGRVVPAAEPGRPIDAVVARETFGVPIEEARTADGRRVLTPALGPWGGGPGDPNEPFGPAGPIES